MTDAAPLLELVDELVSGKRLTTARRARLAGCRDAWRLAEGALERRLLDRPADAERALGAFRRLAAADGGDEAIGRAARLTGSVLVQTDRPRASLRWYRSAEQHLEGAARDGTRIGMAAAWLRLGRFDEAIRACRDAAAAAEERDDALLGGAARLNLGVALHESGRHAEALPEYRTAAAALERAGHGYLHATALQNTGNVLVLLQRFTEAAEAYDEAVRRFSALGLAEVEARCRYNHAGLLTLLDRPDDAEVELVDARQGLERAGSSVQAALCRIDHAELLSRVGLLDEAREEIDTALVSMGSRAPTEERARARLIQAAICLQLGELERARRALSARPRPRSTPLRLERTRIVCRLDVARGRAAHAAGRLDRVLADERTALHRLPRTRLSLRLDLANAYLEAGRLDHARRAAATADRAARASAPAREMWRASALRFRVEAARTSRSASEHLARSLADFERMTRLAGPGRFGRRSPPDFAPWLAAALRHVGEHGKPDQVHAVLAVLGGADAPETPDDPELLALATRLRAATESEAPGADSGTRLRLAPAEPATRDLERALERRLFVPGAETAAPTTSFVALHTDEDGTLLLVVDEGRVHSVAHPLTRSRLQDLLRKLDHEFGAFEMDREFAIRRARRRRDRVHALLEELGGPLAHLGPSERLTLLPTGAWRRVPFAMLRPRGTELVRETTVRCLAGPEARRPGAVDLRAPCVIGFDDGSLAGVDEEIRQVAAICDTSTARTGASATCEAVLNTTRPRLLHVAAHGRHRADAPAMSAVRLADGWLRAAELRRMDLGGSLLIFSGCRTGASPARGGREQSGFVEAAFAAGASDVVASLWNVDDPATTRLMSAFHKSLRAGADAASALRQAQLGELEDGHHPWFWAAFLAWHRPTVR